MNYTIEIKQSAKKELARLEKTVGIKVIAKISALSRNPRPDGCKKLSGSDFSYRVRINDYRVIYSIFDDRLVVQVIKIGHRKDVYK